MVLPFLLNKNLMPVLCNNFLRNKNLVEDIEQRFENIKISEMIHRKDRQSSGQLSINTYFVGNFEGPSRSTPLKI